MTAGLTRRRLIAGAAAGGAALLLPLRTGARQTARAAAAPFSRALPIPPVLTAAELTIPMREADVQILEGAPTRMWTYGGTFPGPTIRRPSGRRTAITFVHELPNAPHLTVHRHGGHNRSTEDGQPGGHTAGRDKGELICDLTPRTPGEERFGNDLLIPPGGRRRYVYDLREDGKPERAAFEWYHDHRCDLSGRHVWNGLAGMFIVDDDVDAALPLPKGEFDIPLLVCDRSFLADNQLADPFFKPGGGGPLATATPQQGLPPSDEVVGDRILVNGAIQPHLEVAARRYRFRLLNAANFTTYNFALANGDDLVQIATESGLLPAPLKRKAIKLSPGERAEVIVDFTGKAGQSIVFKSVAEEGESTGSGAPAQADLMQFRVTRPASDDSRVPEKLRPLPAWAADLSARPDRTWVFGLEYDENRTQPAWGINGQTWNPERVDATPRMGTTESWQLVNASNVPHAIHLHAADWVTLSRNGEAPPAWEQGLKETWLLQPGEAVVVGTKFADYAGRFVIHCHMLEHEDHGMMTQFEVIGKDAPPTEEERSGGTGGGSRGGAGGTAGAGTGGGSVSGRGAPPSLGLPSPKACRSGRIAFRVPRVKGRRYARVLVYVDGRPVRTLRGRALRRLVRLRLGSGRSRVTLVAVTTEGKRFAATRQYTCARPRRRPASRRT